MKKKACRGAPPSRRCAVLTDHLAPAATAETAGNRVALVTNVLGFAGSAATKALLADGLTVCCHDSAFTDASARDAFSADHPGCITLREPSNPAKIVSEVLSSNDRIDVLVNNDDGEAKRMAIEDSSGDMMRKAMEDLLIFPYELTGVVVTQMKAQPAHGGGHTPKIIFVTSATGIKPYKALTLYAVPRAAANHLTKALAMELAPDGITVNAMCPNFLENPSYYPQSLYEPENKPRLDAIVGQIPLGRLGRADEAGDLVSFLSKADWITGQVIPFSGGWVTAT